MMASLAHRRRGKQKRQSQALVEHIRLVLRIVIGQAYETTTALQGIGLGCGMWDVGCGTSPLAPL